MPASTGVWVRSVNANRIEVDYTNNPPLKDLFAHKRAGDACELKMKLKLVSADENGAILEIKKIIAPESYDKGDPDEDDGVKPDSDEPAMIVMRGGKKTTSY